MTTKPTLTITRGLPASGKTSWAHQRVMATNGQTMRVNRDDLRTSLFALQRKTVLGYDDEQAITAAQQASVRALLGAGRDVIVDDTNLRLKNARQWADLAVEVGAEFVVEDQFLAVDVHTCVRRDSVRPDSVGEQIIRMMAQRYLQGKRYLPSVTPTEAVAPAVRPYERPTPGALPTAWLVDIDGTLALMEPGGRGPFDWHRVGEDQPNEPVVSLVRALWAAGHVIVLMSGRDAVCRRATQAWLSEHLGTSNWDLLLMRPERDTRKDSIVKDELFEEHVRDRYDVVGVIDDREQVVRMWRAKGLTVAQVDEGKF